MAQFCIKWAFFASVWFFSQVPPIWLCPRWGPTGTKNFESPPIKNSEKKPCPHQGCLPLDPTRGPWTGPWTPCRDGRALRSLRSLCFATISFFFSTTKWHLWIVMFGKIEYLINFEVMCISVCLLYKGPCQILVFGLTGCDPGWSRALKLPCATV